MTNICEKNNDYWLNILYFYKIHFLEEKFSAVHFFCGSPSMFILLFADFRGIFFGVISH